MQDRMTDHVTTSSGPPHSRTLIWLIGIAIVYDLGVFGLQLFHWLGLSTAGFATGEYSGTLALALCAFASVFIQRATASRRLRVLAWVAAAIFAVLTVDDAFSIHERMNDDDYLAIVFWLIAGGMLLILLRTEKPDRTATVAIGAGFFVHGLAALADGADGGIFTLGTISPFELTLSQELLELAYIGLYLVGFSRIMLGHRSTAVAAPATPVAAAPLAVEDKELLELEAWYWAWRSQAGIEATGAGNDRSIRESLAIVERLAIEPTRSMAGVAAKLRVLRDIAHWKRGPGRDDAECEIRLLEAAADDANRLAEHGAEPVC
jgi:hypothetical protein